MSFEIQHALLEASPYRTLEGKESVETFVYGLQAHIELSPFYVARLIVHDAGV